MKLRNPKYMEEVILEYFDFPKLRQRFIKTTIVIVDDDYSMAGNLSCGTIVDESIFWTNSKRLVPFGKLTRILYNKV